MIQVFKIINGIDDINCDFFFKFTDYDGTRNSYEKLYIQYARTQGKKCTFSRRSAPVSSSSSRKVQLQKSEDKRIALVAGM